MKPRILHIGLGNFARAHLADYTQTAGGWAITGISLRSDKMARLLNPQNGDYTLVIRAADKPRYRKLTCIDHVIFSPDHSETILNAIAADATQIISLTVTEKGYFYDQDGHVDLEKMGLGTGSAIGLLTHGLARRSKPATVLCCDNLPENGRKLERAVNLFAETLGLTLPAGLRFPNSMVDRITPATTDALRKEVSLATGWGDAAPVETEPFTEWIIENNFAGPRPDWEEAGVQIVKDVTPFEARKLRMLNGTHSLLAYMGLSSGHTYVHEAVSDPDIRAAAEQLMEEAAATLPGDLPTEQYASSLMRRFGNSALQHALRQIAMDGSLKLSVRLVPILKASLTARQAVRAWMQFAIDETQSGRSLEDPNAAEIAKACASENPETALCAILGITPDALAPVPSSK